MTHTCAREAIAASALPVGPEALKCDYRVLTFAAPKSAAVGLRERSAEVAALDHRVVPPWVEVKLRRRTVVGIRRRDPLRNVEDGRLIDGIGRGDEYALGELYDRFAGVINGLARRSLGAAAGEEIVQETFLRVWSRASTDSPSRGSLASWVMRIARNLVIDELRRRKARPVSRQLIWETFESKIDTNSSQPDEEVWRDQLRAAVRDACNELPNDHRVVLALAYFGGLTQSQIAEELKIPLGTVKTRTRTALFRLRDLMAASELLD